MVNRASWKVFIVGKSVLKNDTVIFHFGQPHSCRRATTRVMLRLSPRTALSSAA